MPEYGIDLTGSSWTIVTTEYDRKMVPNDTVVCRETSTVQSRPSGGLTLWKHAAKVLSLRADSSLELNAFSEDALKRAFMQNGALPQPFGGERVKPAIAYPTATPPILRVCLPQILGIDCECFGVEAPVAVVLEAVGSDTIGRKGGALATLTAWDDCYELACVDLKVAREEVEITVVESFAFHPNDLDRAWATFRRCQKEPQVQRPLICPAGPAELVARELTRLSTWSGPTVLRAEAVALGAVRFAGLRRLNPGYYLAINPRQVNCYACTAAPLGVLAAAGKPKKWCWRQLFPRATPLSPEVTSSLHSKYSGPTRTNPIVLAECHNPDYFETRWIAQDEWQTADLRWHSTVENSSRDSNPTRTCRWTVHIYTNPLSGILPVVQATIERTDDHVPAITPV